MVDYQKHDEKLLAELGYLAFELVGKAGKSYEALQMASVALQLYLNVRDRVSGQGPYSAPR